MAISVAQESALAKAAQKFRKELLLMPIIGIGRSLEHLTLRTGIRYKETVGELDGSAELAPYTGSDDDDGEEFIINGRDLETYLGACIKYFDPNKIVQSLYGSGITNGKGLEGLDINKAVLAKVMSQLSKNLNKSLFSASRNNAGTTTAELFNGFDTITASDITAGKITAAKGNLFEWGNDNIDTTNAVDVLKAIYRAASDELQDVNVKMYVSKTIYNAYNDDYQATVGAVPYNREFKKTFLEGSDDMCELVPLVGKKNSPYIHVSPKSNMLVGCYQMGDIENIEVRRGNNPWKLQLPVTMFFGTQIESVSPERLLVARKTVV